MRWDQCRAESQPSSTPPSLEPLSSAGHPRLARLGGREIQRDHTHRQETPPVAGTRRRRRVVLGKAVHDSTPLMGGHQLKRNSTPPSIRHPPSPPCLCMRPANPGTPLARFWPVVAEAGRRPSLCCVIFQQLISRPVRPIRLTCCGPMVTARVPIYSHVCSVPSSPMPYEAPAAPSTHSL